MMAGSREAIVVLKHFRARYSKGVLEPLEELDLEEGAEVSVSIEKAPSPKRDPEAIRRAAGRRLEVGQHPIPRNSSG